MDSCCAALASCYPEADVAAATCEATTAVWAAFAAWSQIAAVLMHLVSKHMVAAAALSPEWDIEVALTSGSTCPSCIGND